MAWPNNTRLFWTDLGSKARVTGGGLQTWDIPRVGILSGIYMVIKGTVSSTVTGPNAFGMASIVSNLSVVANSGLQIVSISGQGYHYLLRDMLEHFVDVGFDTTARNVVSDATFDISMWIPIAINSHDPLGLINLQNQDTLLQIQLNWAAESVVATGGPTIAAMAEPYLELFSMPLDPHDMPAFNYAHTITEEQETVSGAGVYTKNWLRNNIYVQMIHGAGFAQSGSDSWTTLALRVDQNRFLIPSCPPRFFDLWYDRYHGRARLAGVIPIDFAGTSGLGNYNSIRDAIDTSQLTDIATLLNASGAITLYSVKRQLVRLSPPAQAGT